jgi:hypothetical protein
MTTAPLTDDLIEAAARELTTPECPWHEGCAGACEAAQAHARAVLNAVRPVLLAEVSRLRTELDSMTKFAEDLRGERDRRLRAEGELGVELDRLRAENTALRAHRAEKRRTFLVSYNLKPNATQMAFGATDVSFTGPLTIGMVEEIQQGISGVTATPLDGVVILSMVELDAADSSAPDLSGEGQANG